jgi:outer membrane lipoprotein LolB
MGALSMKSYKIILLVSVLIGGCATPPSGPLDSTRWETRQRVLNGLEWWDLAGRIGVTNDQQGWHANFNWAQRGPDYSIDISGPMGQGRMRIEGNPGGVEIKTSEGKVMTATDPDRLIETALGVRIPVNGLMYWVRGLPAPNPRAELAGDPEGRLTRLEQSGWLIQYPRYAREAALDMPAQIWARKDDLRIKLIIEQWNLSRG